jgi:bifunctional non-homologous end joining protein LigD
MQAPMRLLTLPEPFDHEHFLFEIKWDGFRALAIIDGGECRLMSRNGHPFIQWDTLKRHRCNVTRTFGDA